MMYDVIIVGGGPAGCATAITASRLGARVLLLERGRYPRHKVCGEFVSPEAVTVLSSLLLPEDRALMNACPNIARMRIFIDGRTICAPIKPHAISLTRYELDLALWRACQAAGVDARQGITAERIEAPDAVVAAGERLSARAVVDATGRWSNLRRVRVVKPKSQYVGLKGHFAENGSQLSSDLYFFAEGYCGVQPIGNDAVNVCAMVRAESAAKLQEVFRLEARLAQRAETWRPLTTPVSTFPLIFRDPAPVQNGVFHAGDAAGFVDPFVGDGISLALQTGLAAAEALCPLWRNGECWEKVADRYTSEYDRRFRPVFRRAARIRRLFSMPLPLRALAAWAAQMPGVSSRLVLLTRAS